MRKILKIIQFLSLDVTLGAVVMAYFVAAQMEVSMSWNMALGLAIAIWLTYTLDHLIDARRHEGDPANPRHLFHKVYFRPLCIAAAAVFAGGLFNLAFLPVRTIAFGLVLILMVVFYFLVVHGLFKKGRGIKELSGALIYTLGIFTAPFSLVPELEMHHILLLLQVLVIVTINLFLFPVFEYRVDREDNVASVATERGEVWVRSRLRYFFGLFLLLLIPGLWPGLWSVGTLWFPGQLTLALMALLLWLLFRYPLFFERREVYRVVGDGVFLLPAFLLLL